MSDSQPELFEAPPPPQPAITAKPDAEAREPSPPRWMVKILLPAAQEIVDNARGTMDFHPADRKKWAKMIAEKLADTALDEIYMIALINEEEDEDEGPY